MKIDANNMHFETLNKLVRESTDSEIVIDNCNGQRYIGSGLGGKTITINGTPGNALGCYLDGCKVVVNGNAQDAMGDTMNEGAIIVKGNSGDATGYAMRGGKIFVKGYTGYRTGIHMKAYKEKQPVIVIGQKAGSFLGEYLAGGMIIVLGLGLEGKEIVGRFCGTGMHGGKIFLRTDILPFDLPKQVKAERATEEDLKGITPILTEYCKEFSLDLKDILQKSFYVLTPNSNNPYKQLYVHN